MNGIVYPKKSNFEFFPRGKTNVTRRRDGYVHFNNRNGNVRWDSFRRQPNTWRVWHSEPRSQATPSSFAAVNPHQNFIPANLIVTVPNFSGVHPPDLFVFRNSSAKSVKFPSAPVTGILKSSSYLPANKDVEANLIKPTEAEKDDDIQYLYTVQTKGGELIEFVDLSEDSKKPDSSDKLRVSENLLPSNSTDSSDARESDSSRIVTQIPEKETVPSSKKQNAARRKGRKRKKSCEDLLCDICEREYKFVQSKGQEVFKARCGHLFCQQCLNELDPYKCPECNVYLQKLFKVFL